MALPVELFKTGALPGLTSGIAPVAEHEPRADFDSLNAQAEASRRFINALGALSERSRNPGSESEIMDSLEHALECVIGATSAKDGALLICDEETGDLVFALVHGDLPKKALLWRRVPAGEGVAHWVFENRSAAIVNNAENDERFYKAVDKAHRFRTNSIIAAPILNGDEVLGVLEILNKRDGRYFSQNDQNHLTLMAHLASELLIVLRDRASARD